jgi:hypothetical protein
MHNELAAAIAVHAAMAAKRRRLRIDDERSAGGTDESLGDTRRFERKPVDTMFVILLDKFAR